MDLEGLFDFLLLLFLGELCDLLLFLLHEPANDRLLHWRLDLLLLLDVCSF